MHPLTERIQFILPLVEHSQTRLAGIAGVHPSSVNLWLSGRTKTLKAEVAQRIADHLGLNYRWVVSGEGDMYKDGVQPQGPTQTNPNPDRGSFTLHRIDTGGGMGKGIVLQDQPGVIEGWRVSREWAYHNIPANTGIGNLRIVTGFGDSMRGMFEPGDPLIVDVGITELNHDGIYFFAVQVGDQEEGFIKRLQRIPFEGIRVISENPKYETYTLRPDTPIRIIGKVLKVWNSEVF
jgi:phage repressor protein C with HTH and peptisase S24 domain